MERNFKVGDKVRIRQWDDMVKEFGGTDSQIQCSIGFLDDMKPLCGKIAKISGFKLIDGMEQVCLDFEDADEIDTDWYYSTDMLELVNREDSLTSNEVINVLMKKLGVEVGEKFNIERVIYNPFYFDEHGNLFDNNGGSREDYIGYLALGEYNIQKVFVKEMTVSEIEKELGYSVKVISDKGEK